MTVDIGTPVAQRPARPRRGAPAPPRDRVVLGLGAVIIAQAVWFAVLMGRGWYYQADFSNLASATGRSLSPAYLTESQGGHLGIVGRLVLWTLNRVGPLDHPLTIALRVLAQAVATYLLARVLMVLVGKRPGVVVVVALYAFSPLLVQSVLWVTSSIGFLSSQIFVLLTLLAHVRYTATRQLRWAAAAAAALIAATTCSEQAAIVAFILPVLSMVYLHGGTIRERVRGLLRTWPEWAMIITPIVGFAAYLLGSGQYLNGRVGVSAWGAVRSVGGEFGNAIAPAFVGGPFAWSSANGNYFAFAEAPTLFRVLAVVVVLGVIAVTVRRTGARALAAWSMPLLVAGVGIVIVAVGRFNAFGTVITRRFEYSAYTAVPAALALALAWWRTTPAAIRTRAGEDAGPPLPPPPPRIGRPARWPVVVAAAVVAASAVSGVTYSNHWSKSPARTYLHNLDSSLARLGPSANLFDTFADPNVVPGILPNRHISDLTALLRAHPHFEDPSSTPRVVGPDGRVVKAGFLPTAGVVPPTDNSFCANPVSGVVDRVEPLDHPTLQTEWFLRVGFFQQHASAVNFTLVDARGHETTPVRGALTTLPGTLATVYLRFPSSTPVAVHIRSESTATNVCLTGVTVGYPFAAAK